MGEAVVKPGERRSKICDVTACLKLVSSHGYCVAHAHRYRRYGNPLGKPVVATTVERFWQKVDAEGDCWEWTGARNSAGYGTFLDLQLRKSPFRAHRWAWVHLVGEILDGLQLDHLCRNRACVNPDHLEPVTNAENGQRGIRGRLYTPPSACRYGHQLNEENLYLDNKGIRYCKEFVTAKNVTAGEVLNTDPDSALRRRVRLFVSKPIRAAMTVCLNR